MFWHGFMNRVQCEKVVRGAGLLRFYELAIWQQHDLSSSFQGDDKLAAIEHLAMYPVATDYVILSLPTI